jgi:hypothetical protein
MDASTAATADSLQKLIAAQDASLKILQKEEAERDKKPKFALYRENNPIDNSPLRLALRGGEEPLARFDLTLKNEGDRRHGCAHNNPARIFGPARRRPTSDKGNRWQAGFVERIR